MRILYVTSLYLPWLGGLEVLASQLVGELRGRGHELAVVTAVNDSGAPLGVAEVEGARVLRTDAYHLAARLDPTELLHRRREIRNFVDDFAPDVVHAHDAGPMLVAYERAVRRPRPLVVTLHNVMTLLAPATVPFLAGALRRADRVTGVSADVVADTLTWAPWLGDRISLVRNAVAPPGPSAGPVPDGPPRLLCVGRLAAQKGFDRALDALARVVASEPRAHLTIVGVGPDRGALADQIARLGLERHATLRGRVEHHEIGPLLAASTALVMPSRFEGLPLVALEAAWMARPVVGSDVPGLRCAVADGVTGLLVPDGDVGALAAALLRLIDDRELARELGAAARAAVARDWSLSACASQYEALYGTLVPDGRG
jgi:glycosyltransferase involved in cell wall biosynthesis